MMDKIKAVGYIRYSDKKQDGNHSIDIQKNHIKQLAARKGLEIINWRIDKATSAFHLDISKREGIQGLFDDIEDGVEAICFYEESRITRSITDFYDDVYYRIKEQYPYVKIYNTQTNDELDPNNPMTQMKLVIASQESEIKSTRAKDTHKSLLYQDEPKRPGSRTPIGYDMDDGVLIPNNDAKFVQLIFYLASFGHSNKVISNYLNKCHITTQKVKHWNSSTINYVLSNRAYVGDLAWNTRRGYKDSKSKPMDEIDLLHNTHVSIIGPTLYYLVNQANDLKHQYSTMDTPYLLRGILICKQCKVHLIAKDNSPKGKKGKYMVYRCPSCKKSSPITPIHHAVYNNLKQKWKPELPSHIKKAKSDLKKWSNRLNKAKDDKQEITVKAYINGHYIND